MKIVSITLVIVVVSFVNGQEKVSPCPRIFNYDRTNENSDTWSGVLTLDTQIKLYGVIVDVVFDRAIIGLTSPGTYYDVRKKSNVEYKLEDSNFELDVGATLTIRFTVRFSQYGKTPLLKEVRFNGQKICDAQTNSVRGTDRPASGSTSTFVQPLVPVNHQDDMRPTRGSSTRPTSQTTYNGNQLQDGHYDTSYNRGATTSTTSRRPQASNSGNRPVQNTNYNDEDFNDYSRTTRRPVTSNSANNGRTTSTLTPRRQTSVVNANSFTSNDDNGYESSAGQYVRPQTTTKRPSFFQGDLSFSKGDRSPHSIVTESDDSTCGTVVAKAAPLIVFGESTISGQFPWHAAIYISTVEQLKYICGGALISRRALLTAAHCVCIEKTENPINTDSLLIYLGKYNLRKWTGPEQDGKVSEIIVHPDYDHSRFYSDIAVLRLKDDISIDNHVRPVCLWEFNNDLKMIVDKLGEVPGWGYNEYGVVNEVLSSVKMPVVAHETCIWSNRDFFSRVTSDKSFCAGFRNLTSVCNGDSGGGMVFKNNNKWFLRGLVSVSVALQNKLRCDPSEYAVFTDVAKFLPWIRSHM